MVKYECVVPGVDGVKYDLVYVHDDAMSVEFVFEKSSGEKIKIRFDTPAMYSVMNECYDLVSQAEDGDSIFDGTLLYRVHGSHLTDVFHGRSYDTYRDSGMEHYMIWCLDNIAHIFTQIPPVVSQFPAE